MKFPAVLAWFAVVAVGLPATAHDALLPLGDGRVSDRPLAGQVFSCVTRFGGGGAQVAGPWIKGQTWDPKEKHVVVGKVSWPNAAIAVSIEGGRRIVRANNLPNHPTGIYPIGRDDPAYRYDRNPNAIRAQTTLLNVPANPTFAPQPSCVPMGMIGIALSGAAIFNALDAQGRDAPAHEIQDLCNGHPERSGQYHYHDYSPCLGTGPSAAPIGFALDGFGILGPLEENGREVTNADLDSCHGHSHDIVWDGARRAIYHYHFTHEYPYTVGCFRGTVDAALPRAGPPPGPPPRPGGLGIDDPRAGPPPR